jgi:hypothetical protein
MNYVLDADTLGGTLSATQVGLAELVCSPRGLNDINDISR